MQTDHDPTTATIEPPVPTELAGRRLDRFDVDAYRHFNRDLATLDDATLAKHFRSQGLRERRIFGRTETTAEFMAMRWLRGTGLEIGAGRYPTTLFGATSCLYADLPGGDFFGQDEIDVVYSLNDPPSADSRSIYDFAICSHVLEHVDSVLRSLRYLREMVIPGGVIYVVVPDRDGLRDADWMPRYDFQHHLIEDADPLVFAADHDRLAVEAARAEREKLVETGDALFQGQSTGKELLDLIDSGSIADHRFVFHKHTYDMDGWTRLMVGATTYLTGLAVRDVRYGYERLDCHFVLERIR